MRNSGFTLIEILVVIALGAVLSTAGFLSYNNYQIRKSVELSLQELGSTVEQVQRRSVTQEDGDRWSIRFTATSTGEDTYSIYRGDTYSTGSTTQSYSFKRAVHFSEPLGDRAVDLNFEPVSGKIDNKKIITITNDSPHQIAGDIIVNTLGVVTEKMRDNILGYWHFDEGTGATTTDASGSGNAGTINGATWESGSNCIAGQCLSFDGSNDYIDIGDLSGDIISDPTDEDMSWGGWISPNNHSENGYIISSGAQTSSRGLYMLMNSSEQIDCGLKEESNEVSVTTGGLSTGSFINVFCTFDQSTGVITAYVDGQVSASSTETSNSFTDTASDLTIGTSNNNKGNFIFNGKMDEVKIYNNVLSSSTIKDNYNDLK